MLQRTVLSHTDAMKIIGVIQHELDEQGKGAAVAVVDEHGELIAFLRTDGAGDLVAALLQLQRRVDHALLRVERRVPDADGVDRLLVLGAGTDRVAIGRRVGRDARGPAHGI